MRLASVALRCRARTHLSVIGNVCVIACVLEFWVLSNPPLFMNTLAECLKLSLAGGSGGTSHPITYFKSLMWHRFHSISKHPRFKSAHFTELSQKLSGTHTHTDICIMYTDMVTVKIHKLAWAYKHVKTVNTHSELCKLLPSVDVVASWKHLALFFFVRHSAETVI